MDSNLILTGLSQAAWTLGGAIAILGIFLLSIGGMTWVLLKVGKWILWYIHKVRGEFKDAFQEINGVEKKRAKA